VLVTSPIHMTRSLAAFRAAGLDPIPSSAPLRGDPDGRFWTILPDIESLSISDGASYEYVALAYVKLGFDPYVQMVVEYARQSPALFREGLRKKAAFALGWFGALRPGTPASTFYIAAWAAALGGVLLIAIGPLWLPRAGSAALIPLALALSHLAVLVVVFPSVYGDRLLLPFYALLAPYIGIAGAAIAEPAFRARRWRAPAR